MRRPLFFTESNSDLVCRVKNRVMVGFYNGLAEPDARARQADRARKFVLDVKNRHRKARVAGGKSVQYPRSAFDGFDTVAHVLNFAGVGYGPSCPCDCLAVCSQFGRDWKSQSIEMAGRE